MNNRHTISPLDDTLLVLIDGDCVLCTGAARWMLDRDRHRRLRIAPLGGTTARQLGLTPDTPPETWSMLVRTSTGEILDRSDAVVAIGRALPAPWSWLAAAGSAIPGPLRNAIYRLIARYRRHVPGKAACPMPGDDDRARILP
ncbi:MAG: DCC1-like thiol-disulfide oxidoreductase family protein [Planctomycetota bacterium]